MKFRLFLVFSLISISGCTTTGGDTQKMNHPNQKTEPYSDSVFNTIKDNQQIYKEQMEVKKRESQFNHR